MNMDTVVTECEKTLNGTANVLLGAMAVALFVPQGSAVVLRAANCGSRWAGLRWRLVRLDGASGGYVTDDGFKYGQHPSTDDLRVTGVDLGDAGIYYATVNSTHRQGPIYFLEVYPSQRPLTLSRPSQREPYNEEDIVLADSNLRIYRRPSDWSRCTTCGAAPLGARHRLETCYVEILNGSDPKGHPALRSFDGGLPCRSSFLPPELSDLEAVSEVEDASVWTSCTPEEKVWQRPSPKANSQEDMVRKTVTVAEGETALLECPVYSDWGPSAGIVWRRGNETLWPWSPRLTADGRMSLDAAGRLRLSATRRSDRERVFTCCSGPSAIATVTVVVLETATFASGVYAVTQYLAYAVSTAALLLVTYRMFSNREFTRQYV